MLLVMNFSDCMTYLNSASQREKENYKTQLSLAWKTAYWQRCDPKKFPELQKILDEVDKPSKTNKTSCDKPQTAQDMFEVVKMLHERMRGGSNGKKK